MRVLMQNRPEELWQGGDMIQLRATQAALSRLGVDVEYSGAPVYPSPLGMRNFDVVHNFNFSMKWNKYQTWVAKKHKKPLVCSMIYHEGEQFIRYSDQQIMADHTDAMIFLTKGEIERVKRHIRIDDAKCHIIPNGIDPDWFKDTLRDPNMPRYVLTVGRVEPSKGQLEVALACQEIGIHYMMIGQRTDEGYARRCEDAGATYCAPMDKNDLIRMYANCSVFALASKAEVMPLTVMEAMAQAAPVVLTDRCEWETPHVLRCSHGDVGSIKGALQMALVMPRNTLGQEEMRSVTWDHVASKLLNIYNMLCATL